MLTSSDPIPASGTAPEAAGDGPRADTLPALLENWARNQGEKIALSCLDHHTGPEDRIVSLTWSELEHRVRETATWLRHRVEPGGRVALLVPHGPEYVLGFLAALHAGLVAVPLFAPVRPAHGDRLDAILADAGVSVVLTTRAQQSRTQDVVHRLCAPRPEVVAVEATRADPEPAPLPARDDLAYLQYTSGSTRVPAGVMITHGNLVACARQAAVTYGVLPGRSVTVSWLPLYHDMGLMLAVLAPCVLGIRSVLLDPAAFLERPARWLRALSTFPGAISAAPSFAYGYAAARVTERERSGLRLDQVGALIDGGEPVRAELFARFRERFACCGLPATAHCPSYGLAESTVLVAGVPAAAAPVSTTFYRAQLARGDAVQAEHGEQSTVTLTSCGWPAGQEVRIVHPQTGAELPDGKVGEIWVNGPNVGRGYWQRPAESAATFCALLAGDEEPRWWLRTGDLGLRFDSRLYVTGRLKDLIVVDGRKHYPQDVEATVEGAHPAIRPHMVAAFAVPDSNGDQVVVLAERSGWVIECELDPEEVTRAIRHSVAREHGLPLHDVLLLAPDEVPRTTSGKIARAACRERYVCGGFAGSRVS
ncbi:fatty acyl-AMP ligase [Amycolatopsis aidingensis]|uniref:fatty acyl-AMP ligase n=1 Tax=Amycolatopsis aidingensis TaxID=2842453 RepID=UPI001C0E5CEF|nr:fatty acyl-AMP ligase [Amycolatopsis aidingensis]